MIAATADFTMMHLLHVCTYVHNLPVVISLITFLSHKLQTKPRLLMHKSLFPFPYIGSTAVPQAQPWVVPVVVVCVCVLVVSCVVIIIVVGIVIVKRRQSSKYSVHWFSLMTV